MKRHENFVDPNASPYGSSQMQQVYAPRMQHNAGMRNYPERPDSFALDNEHLYRSSKADGYWQRDGDAQRASSQIPSHVSGEDAGRGGNGSRPGYPGQMVDPKLDFKKQDNKEGSVQVEEDMEIGYEDSPSPLTFEGLQQKFLDGIKKVVKEQSDAEDAENSRHREKMVDINTQYHERLVSIRARQANRREEYLEKESQARLHQYQQARMNNLYQNSPGAVDVHPYGGASNTREAPRPAYDSATQFDPYRERTQYSGSGSGRAQSTEGRIPYPSGRVYNNSNVHYPDIP